MLMIKKLKYYGFEGFFLLSDLQVTPVREYCKEQSNETNNEPGISV